MSAPYDQRVGVAAWSTPTGEGDITVRHLYANGDCVRGRMETDVSQYHLGIGYH